MTTTTRRYTLSLSCPDRVGIVAAVSNFLAAHSGWITEASHHADTESQRFFMRQELLADSLTLDIDTLRSEFAKIAAPFDMKWRISDSARKKRVVILVSKQEHCLYDLLGRWQSGELDIDIPCVISNHETFRGLVEWHGIPFHHVPVTPDTKAAAYAKVEQLYVEAEADVMVLARYMQILSPELCAKYPGQIINIHHSFLPSFKGARPYFQAHDRGVKLIGATAHYVTADLDEGPIIEQVVQRVDHTYTPEKLAAAGRDSECAALATAVRLHIEHRVFLNSSKTVIFK